MKILLTVLMTIVCCDMALAVQQVTSVSLAGHRADKPVTVAYALAGEDAIVTAEILLNGVAIDVKKTLAMTGDVNKLVSAGSRSFVWTPPANWWGDGDIRNVRISAKLTAWPTNSPPDYMVLDLEGKKTIDYYVSEDALPLGVDSDVYRTSKLVMRRIHAKGREFRLGATCYNEVGLKQLAAGVSTEVSECTAQAMLTHDYYLGIFEMTQGQYYRLNNTWWASGRKPSQFTNSVAWATRPLEHIQYSQIMDGNWPNDDPAKANASSKSSGHSFGYLRELTGLDWHLTLPTETQWEYACRAGTYGSAVEGYEETGLYYTPSGAESPTVYTPGLKYARTADNGGLDYITDGGATTNFNCDATVGTARVGSYLSNAWGLYDMLGNVSEMCIEWSGRRYNDNGKPSAAIKSFAVDPVGSTSDYDGLGSQRLTRGGSCKQTARECRPSLRGSQQMWQYSDKEFVGFRVCYLLEN